MARQVFPATYFSFETKYPQSGTRLQLGNSYQFDVMPSSPDQRTFLLTLHGMAYFTNTNGTLNRTTKPERNILRLEDFYNAHKTALEFDLAHPVYGTVVCKFNTPLTIPSPLPNANGNLPSFEVELIEVP